MLRHDDTTVRDQALARGIGVVSTALGAAIDAVGQFQEAEARELRRRSRLADWFNQRRKQRNGFRWMLAAPSAAFTPRRNRRATLPRGGPFSVGPHSNPHKRTSRRPRPVHRQSTGRALPGKSDGNATSVRLFGAISNASGR